MCAVYHRRPVAVEVAVSNLCCVTVSSGNCCKPVRVRFWLWLLREINANKLLLIAWNIRAKEKHGNSAPVHLQLLQVCLLSAIPVSQVVCFVCTRAGWWLPLVVALNVTCALGASLLREDFSVAVWIWYDSSMPSFYSSFPNDI